MREGVHLGEDAARGGARVIHAPDSRGRCRQRRDVLAAGGELRAHDVIGLLDPDAGLLEQAHELAAKVAIVRGDDERRVAGSGLGGVRRPGESGHSTAEDALGDVLGRPHAERAHEPLRADDHCGAAADARGDLADGGRKVAARHREDNKVHGLELDLRDRLRGDAVGKLDARQAVVVGAAAGDALGLLAGAAPELDLEAGARQKGRQRRAHRPRSHHSRGAERGDAAEPLVLELDARPDPGGHLTREMRGGLLDAREGERTATADANLARADDEAPPRALGAHDGDGHHRSAGLEREPADATLRSPSEPRRMRVPSGKIITASPRSTSWRAVSIASSSDSPRRIGNAPSEFRNQPIQRLLEQLALGDEVGGAAEAHADDPRVEEAAVVRREDHAALGGDVLAADSLQPEEQHEEGWTTARVGQ